MKRRALAVKLIAVLAVGGLLLPTAAPVVCELRASSAMGMDGMADHEDGQPTQTQLGTATIASVCVSVANCVTSQSGFSVTHLTFETSVDLLMGTHTPLQTMYVGRAFAPPTPPPRA